MAVNRWNFMKVCVVSGQDWMTCTLSYTLFMLAVIHDTVDLTRPLLRMLDAGCGSGFLMALWAEMTGPGAEIWGLELDPDMVHIARRELCESKDTFSEGWTEKCSKIRVVRGDMQHMLAGSPAAIVPESSLEELEPFPSMYFDVIVLGVAVSSVPERVVECLNEGGVLVAAAQVEGSPMIHDDGATRRRSQFQVWRKEGGAIRRLCNVGCDDAGDGLHINFITCSVWQEDFACTPVSLETPVHRLPAEV
jgi:protein-L-isoaspartate O-methyltransferase